MKIAFCNRKNYDNPLGGDAVQMLKTKEALEHDYQVIIDVITDPQKITSDYDLVHIFNFSFFDICDSFVEKAKSLSIPIAISSIYWDYSYSNTTILRGKIGEIDHLSWTRIRFERLLVKLASILGFNKPYTTSKLFRRYIKKFITDADVILPNSYEERDCLLRFAGLDLNTYKSKFAIVYNAVDGNSAHTPSISKADFLKKYNIPDHYILQVGRIENVKNQGNVIYALRNHPEIPLVFVGSVREKSYLKKISQVANKRGNVYFISAVPHDEIACFYKYADLHVLLSLRESPGLVTLEAQKENCPVVVASSEFAPCGTYFSSCPYVVNPCKIDEIEEVLLKAYKERKQTPLNLEDFSWKKAGEQTYNAYLEVLKK